MEMHNRRRQVGFGLSPVKSEDVVASAHQSTDDMGPNKPRPADYKNSHDFPPGLLCRPGAEVGYRLDGIASASFLGDAPKYGSAFDARRITI
jgi:hypothetical protein